MSLLALYSENRKKLTDNVDDRAALHNFLGLSYERDSNIKAAIAEYKKASEFNSTEAFFHLARSYYLSAIPSYADKKLGIEYLKKAAYKDNVDAQNTLGKIYLLGEKQFGIIDSTEKSLAIDIDKAIFWFEKAATNGCAAASLNVAKAYLIKMKELPTADMDNIEVIYRKALDHLAIAKQKRCKGSLELEAQLKEQHRKQHLDKNTASVGALKKFIILKQDKQTVENKNNPLAARLIEQLGMEYKLRGEEHIVDGQSNNSDNFSSNGTLSLNPRKSRRAMVGLQAKKT